MKGGMLGAETQPMGMAPLKNNELVLDIWIIFVWRASSTSA